MPPAYGTEETLAIGRDVVFTWGPLWRTHTHTPLVNERNIDQTSIGTKLWEVSLALHHL